MVLQTKRIIAVVTEPLVLSAPFKKFFQLIYAFIDEEFAAVKSAWYLV